MTRTTSAEGPRNGPAPAAITPSVGVPLTNEEAAKRARELPHMQGAPDVGDDGIAHPAKIVAEVRADLALLVPQDPSDLGLGGVTLESKGLRFEGKPLLEIGRGCCGVVYAHPTDRDLVAKLVQPNGQTVEAMGDLFPGQNPREVLYREHIQQGEILARGDAGPKNFGGCEIEGGGRKVRLTIHRRVHGSTLDVLADKRRFGAAEVALMDQLVQRMAKNSLVPGDLKVQNIMIGTTTEHPEPRAYLVDCNEFHHPASGDIDAVAAQIWDTPFPIGTWFDTQSGRFQVSSRTLGGEVKDLAAFSEYGWFRRLLHAYFSTPNPPMR